MQSRTHRWADSLSLIDENEPAGKPLALCKKVSVKLALYVPEEDIPVYRKSGLRGLRHSQDCPTHPTKPSIQGGVLSYEDVASFSLVVSSPSKRDMSQMRKAGNHLALPRAGVMRWDEAKRTKTQILDLYSLRRTVHCHRTTYKTF